MKSRKLALTVVLTFGPAGLAAAADAEAPEPAAQPARPPLDVTMRVIENPAAMTPGAITRRITLPPPSRQGQEQPNEKGARSAAPQQAEDGQRIAQEARERNRDFGREAAEHAREMADEAAERREDFGHSKAEEMRPERPEPPRPPRP